MPRRDLTRLALVCFTVIDEAVTGGYSGDKNLAVPNNLHTIFFCCCKINKTVALGTKAFKKSVNHKPVRRQFFENFDHYNCSLSDNIITQLSVIATNK